MGDTLFWLVDMMLDMGDTLVWLVWLVLGEGGKNGRGLSLRLQFSLSLLYP